MKTTGLDFISAVKAVKNGLCEKAHSESANRCIYKDDENELVHSVSHFKTILATDYELINPRAPMEEVEVNVQIGVYPDGKMVLAPETWNTDYPLIDVPVRYQRHVKEKVKQKVYADRIRIDEGLWGQLTNDFPKALIGKRGTLTFEWEEEA